MNVKKRKVVVHLKMCFLVVVLFTVSIMHGMEKDNGKYAKLPDPVDRIEVVRDIEKTKLQLHHALHSWSSGCCQSKIFGLEQRLALFTQREDEIEQQYEVASVGMQDLVNYKEGPTKLDFSNQKLATIRGILTAPGGDLSSITKLVLSRNSLVTLSMAKVVAACPVLKYLDVSDNNLAFIAYGDDTYSVPRLNSLEKLLLRGNKLKEFDFDSCLYMFPNVKKLDISGNDIDQYAWRNISGWLHEDTEENPWPIINIAGTHLDKEELCSRYTAMGIRFFEHGHYKSILRWCYGGTLVGLMLGVFEGGLLAAIGGSITQNPLWLWPLGSLVVTTPLGAIIGGCLAKPCMPVTHDERMEALNAAQANIRNGGTMGKQKIEDIV